MKTFVLSLVFGASLVANALSNNNYLQGFAYNSEGDGTNVTTQSVFKVENKKYLKRHLKYNFTYDTQGRITSKEVLKWSVVRDAYEKQYCLNFDNNGSEVTVQYALWNATDEAYTDVKEKSIYRGNGADIKYLSYEWNKKENAWNLTLEHAASYDEAVKLLAEK